MLTRSQGIIDRKEEQQPKTSCQHITQRLKIDLSVLNRQPAERTPIRTRTKSDPLFDRSERPPRRLSAPAPSIHAITKVPEEKSCSFDSARTSTLEKKQIVTSRRKSVTDIRSDVVIYRDEESDHLIFGQDKFERHNQENIDVHIIETKLCELATIDIPPKLNGIPSSKPLVDEARKHVLEPNHLMPVIVEPNQAGNLRLIQGLRIIQIAKALHFEKIPCIVMPEITELKTIFAELTTLEMIHSLGQKIWEKQRLIDSLEKLKSEKLPLKLAPLYRDRRAWKNEILAQLKTVQLTDANPEIIKETFEEALNDLADCLSNDCFELSKLDEVIENKLGAIGAANGHWLVDKQQYIEKLKAFANEHQTNIDWNAEMPDDYTFDMTDDFLILMSQLKCSESICKRITNFYIISCLRDKQYPFLHPFPRNKSVISYLESKNLKPTADFLTDEICIKFNYQGHPIQTRFNLGATGTPSIKVCQITTYGTNIKRRGIADHIDNKTECDQQIVNFISDLISNNKDATTGNNSLDPFFTRVAFCLFGVESLRNSASWITHGCVWQQLKDETATEEKPRKLSSALNQQRFPMSQQGATAEGRNLHRVLTSEYQNQTSQAARLYALFNTSPNLRDAEKQVIDSCQLSPKDIVQRLLGEPITPGSATSS